MFVVLLQGGLGNQMFEYAAAYCFARKYGQDLKLYKVNLSQTDHDNFRLNSLSITYSEDLYREIPAAIRIISNNRLIRRVIKKSKISDLKLGKWLYITQLGAQFRDQIELNNIQNVLLDGYWQNPRFFDAFAQEISKEFVPSFELSTKCKEWLITIRSTESVALHIRRGDYLKKENSEYLVKEEYYKDAIKYILEKKPNAEFFIFSDDKQWCKSNFPAFHVVELEGQANSDIEEMYLMSQCQNNINANSSFSWWGSYLNRNPDKIVINPERPWNPQMIPDGWYVAKNSGLSNNNEIFITKNNRY